MTELVAIEDLAASAAQPWLDCDGVKHLRGGECVRCHKRFFPLKAVCPYCSEAAPRIVALANIGKLYSFTTVHVASNRKTPYQLGYLDIEPNVRVLANLHTDNEPLQIDMQMQLATEADGSWSFRPVFAASVTS